MGVWRVEVSTESSRLRGSGYWNFVGLGVGTGKGTGIPENLDCWTGRVSA